MGILRTDVVSHSQLEGSGSVEFDGVGDYLTFGSHDSFTAGTSDVTFELWVYLTDSTNLSSGNYYLFDMGNNGYRLQIYNGTLYFGDGSNTVSGSGITKNAWHHVAGVRDSGAKKLYLDGNLIKENACSVNHSTNTLTIGSYATGGGDYEPYGYISNFRYVRGVVYRNNFTPPKFELKNIPGTIVLGCQSTTSATDFAVTPSTVTAQGDATASAFHPNLKKDRKDTGVVFDGFGNFATSTYMVPPSGKTTERNRGRGVLAGGYVHPNLGHNSMMYIEIQTQGNAQDFGDLTVARSYFVAGQTSSSTRGLNSGGFTSPGSSINVIDFITIANTANATDFGDTINVRPSGGLSNQTRSVHAGTTSPFSNVIDFVTIATTGDAQNFGDLVEPQSLFAGASSSTRGVFGGGRNNTPSENTLHNTMQFITIATTGDAQDFGDLQATRYGHTGFSSPTRGIFAGGYLTPGQTTSIDFFTIATLGNSQDFGDLSTATGYGGSVTNSIRGVVTCGDAPNYYNILEFITIATTGNASDFGDTDPSGSGKGQGDYPSCISDSHGGVL